MLKIKLPLQTRGIGNLSTKKEESIFLDLIKKKKKKENKRKENS